MDKRFLNFVDKKTGIIHKEVAKMTDDEKKSNCMIYVSYYDYKEDQRYVKRIKTCTEEWYAIEISYEEYCYWVAHSQFEMFKKINKISNSNMGMDIEQMIRDATNRLQKFQALEEETAKLPEEDLVDEETFRKMMGQDT